MVAMWRKGLAAAVFGVVLLGSGGTAITGSGAGEAYAQGAYPSYAAPYGLHRECRRKIRAAYRAPGCTRRCYPRNFYRQRMDYCVQSGGSI